MMDNYKTINKYTDNEITINNKIFLNLIYGFFAVQIITVSVYSLSFYIFAHNTSTAIYNSNRNSIIEGDYRSAKRAIRSALSNSNANVKLISHDGQMKFFIQSTKQRLISFDFTYFVGLTEKSNHLNDYRLIFTYNLVDEIYSILILITVVSFIYTIISLYLFKVLEGYYRNQIIISNKIKAAEISQQVAHDIKSPLSFLNVFADKMSGELGSKADILNRAIKRINDIVSDLESTEGKSTTFDAALAIEQMYEEKSLEIKQRLNVSLEIKLEAHDTFISLNKADFLRTISNIINNAAEASEKHGTVIIALSKEKEILKLSITDKGTGMDKMTLKKVFDRGYSSKSSSGLGLYHAKKTVENANGKIEISSTIGNGTKVTITLPTFLKTS